MFVSFFPFCAEANFLTFLAGVRGLSMYDGWDGTAKWEFHQSSGKSQSVQLGPSRWPMIILCATLGVWGEGFVFPRNRWKGEFTAFSGRGKLRTRGYCGLRMVFLCISRLACIRVETRRKRGGIDATELGTEIGVQLGSVWRMNVFLFLLPFSDALRRWCLYPYQC